VPWEVVTTEVYRDWYETLSDEQRAAVIGRVDLLKAVGPALGRPTVDSIVESRHRHMKELRVSKEGALRTLFVFDPDRRAVLLLLGGDKTGDWAGWYQTAIPQADALYDEYLQDLEEGS
jgi:hypothetical protein